MQNFRKAIRLSMWIVAGSIALATQNLAQAGFLFSVTQRDVGAPISVGSETIFDVTVALEPNLPSIDNLAGISFFVGLGDPTNWGGTHPAGVLRSGTNDSSSPLAGGRNYLFGPADGGGFLNDNADFLAFSVSTTTGRTLSTTPSFLGTFILDSSNGVPGDYSLMFAPNEFGVQDPSSNLLPGTYSGAPLNFTMITAVPEPSSWLLFATAAGVLGLLGRKRIISQSSASAA